MYRYKKNDYGKVFKHTAFLNLKAWSCGCPEFQNNTIYIIIILAIEMGITGLLPILKPIIENKHISFWKGKRVAVDTYSWIHKALYGCATDFASHPDTSKWLNYCLNYIDMLLSNNIEVYLVFDGASLPAKKTTESRRTLSRSKSWEQGLQHIQNGDNSAARIHMAKAIDVTPRMAAKLIRLCKLIRPNVKCVVAPYEADAQLAYLSKYNLVDAIISEDSDNIPFGCKEVLNCLRIYLLLL